MCVSGLLRLFRRENLSAHRRAPLKLHRRGGASSTTASRDIIRSDTGVIAGVDRISFSLLARETIKRDIQRTRSLLEPLQISATSSHPVPLPPILSVVPPFPDAGGRHHLRIMTTVLDIQFSKVIFVPTHRRLTHNVLTKMCVVLLWHMFFHYFRL